MISVNMKNNTMNLVFVAISHKYLLQFHYRLFQNYNYNKCCMFSLLNCNLLQQKQIYCEVRKKHSILLNHC